MCLALYNYNYITVLAAVVLFLPGEMGGSLLEYQAFHSYYCSPCISTHLIIIIIVAIYYFAKSV